MSQVPDNHQYDPVNNWQRGGNSDAYTQNSAGAVYANLMRWPQHEEYQLRKPQSAAIFTRWSHHEEYQLRRPPGGVIKVPSGQFPQAYYQATPYAEQQPGQNSHLLQNSATLNAAHTPHAAFAPNAIHPPHVSYESNPGYPSNAAYDYSALNVPEQPNQALAPVVSSYPNRTPESNALYADPNHAVGWQGNPREYQEILAEKDNVNSSNHTTPFSRMRKKGNSPRRKAISVNDLVHDDASGLLDPTPTRRRDSNKRSHAEMSADVSNSLHTAQNKKAAWNVPGRDAVKRERVVAALEGESDQPVHAETTVNVKQEPVAAQEEKPTHPDESRAPNNVSKPSVVVSSDKKVANASRVASKSKGKGDVAIGALARKKQAKDEPSLKRESTLGGRTDDIFSTIPLKTSRFAVQSETKNRKEKVTLGKGRRVQSSRVTKSTKAKKKPQGRRGIHSYTLFEHSGDESSENSEEKTDSRNDVRHRSKKPSTFSNSDDEDFDDTVSRSKQKHSNARKADDKANMNGIKRINGSQRKGKELRGATRRSSRLSKRKIGTELELEGKSNKKRKEVHKNARKVEKTKDLDELSDRADEGGAQDERAGANGGQSDSSDDCEDFVPTSERGRQFEAMKAKWNASRRAAGEQSTTPKKGAKRSTKKQKKRKRTPAKSNASDGDNTRVDDQDSDSYSPNASQRGSQPLNVKITSLATGRRKKKVDYEDERKRLTENELSTIRIAFTAHYPLPPSNAQVQGRFEMKYGREMSQAMIQGLWEKELKHWSERWWSLYMSFNNVVRGKKLAKPVDKNPSLSKKEVEGWAKSFYEEHGDARVSPNGLKPDGSKSNNSNGSKNENETQPLGRETNAGKGEYDKCVPKTDVNSEIAIPDGSDVASRADPLRDQAVTDSKAAEAKEGSQHCCDETDRGPSE
ncbi:hypothetical protein FGB62_13g235 [Gracilaria domingensis]|nr:hypothetical protein FGB62_13g235 [Gracilaria domingensis]